LLLTEMRRRALSEMLRVLDSLTKTEDPNLSTRNPRILAQLYSTLSLLEGLLIHEENSVEFPKENQVRVLKDLLRSKRTPLIRMCTKALHGKTLHLAQAEPLVVHIINILERITRFNIPLPASFSGVPQFEGHFEELPAFSLPDLQAENVSSAVFIDAEDSMLVKPSLEIVCSDSEEDNKVEESEVLTEVLTEVAVKQGPQDPQAQAQAEEAENSNLDASDDNADAEYE
jgi:hypothetical protein